MRVHTIIEYSHRLFVTVVSSLVLAVVIVAWLKYRSNRSIFWPSFAAFLALGVQAWLGARVVAGDLPPVLVGLHLFNALGILGLLTFVATSTGFPKGGRLDKTAAYGIAAAVWTVAVLIVGSFVSHNHAALVFKDWPLMNGTLAPPSGGGPGMLHYTHRFLAGFLGVILVLLSIHVSRSAPKERTLIKLAHGAGGLWLAQVLVGGLNVLTKSAPWAIILHVLLGSLLWATLVAFCVVAFKKAVRPAGEITRDPRSAADPVEVAEAPVAPLRDKVKAYFALTKPRIIELLLITTVPAMILAARGWPSTWLVVATLIGGTLSAGSANSINCYLDRDIDEKMPRTSIRPLPRHQVGPRNALVFGIILGFAGFAWLSILVNVAAALLSLSAILFYVFIYTILMKRTTPSNIVIGGAAGAVPVLVGWAAVTGGLSRAAWVMFAIVFYWTPPHFWALAMRYSDEYAAAGVPMLPVVRGLKETSRQILLYTMVLFATSLLLLPVARLGVLYLAAAVVLGVAFVVYALALYKKPDQKTAMGAFHFSISYLVLLFVAVALDRLFKATQPVGLYDLALATAAVVFVTFEGIILLSVVRYRGGGRVVSAVSSPRLKEVLWTVIPIIAMAGLFLLTWQAQTFAAP